MRILITGATGFLGLALAQNLSLRPDFEILCSVRQPEKLIIPNVKISIINEVSANTDWQEVLRDVDVVIHLAGRAHILQSAKKNALQEFRSVNVEGTSRLAQQAADSGVKRFIFVSSIGVNGNQTIDSPFTELSKPEPHTSYAHSKWEAECCLRDISNSSGMQHVIVRPPLIYAAHAPGNLRRLLWLLSTGFPLPLKSVSNKRSFISLGNIVDFLSLCVEHPAAADELFLVSDGIDISTPNFIDFLGRGMNRQIKMLPMPLFFLEMSAFSLGRKNMFIQMCASLQIDSGKSRSLLGWEPKETPEMALVETGYNYFKSTVSK